MFRADGRSEAGGSWMSIEPNRRGGGSQGIVVAALVGGFPVAALPQATASAQDTTEAAQSEEIVVTGTRLELSKGEGPQEVQVYTEETIRRSGQTTVGDFLNTLPGVSLIVDPGSLQTAGFATSVRLHGLPLGTTLVLIDGRRMETTSAAAFDDVFDLNNVPLAAL